ELRACYSAAAADARPSIVFAYTVKGWGLPTAGNRLNHAALLTGEQIDVLRRELGIDAASEWDRFPDGSPAAQLCEQTATRLRRSPVSTSPSAPSIPLDTGI